MSQTQSKTKTGFTIIEVLIVLAIAGLILLIVFLAVPALQRNSRNTTMKNDVQNVLGGVAEYQAANNGKMPFGANAVDGTGTVTFQDSSTTSETTTSIKIQGTTVVKTVATIPTAPGSVAQGEIQVVLGRRCDASPSTRAIAAYYVVETSAPLSTAKPTCQEG
jgi:prepilin-type N-terminal cleavage/methylation domain-containing protein